MLVHTVLAYMLEIIRAIKIRYFIKMFKAFSIN
jgi:hypothetical protein